jgi:hypothetical protein
MGDTGTREYADTGNEGIAIEKNEIGDPTLKRLDDFLEYTG